MKTVKRSWTTSQTMRIGRVAFLKSVRACCFLPGNGHDRHLTPKTLSRKLSSSFGGETTGSITEHSFTQLCVRSLSTLFVATNAAPDARLLFLPTPIQPSSRSLNGRSEERRVGKECRSRWSPDQ